MNKKIITIGALVLIFALGLLGLTGCGNNEPKIEKETLTKEESKYIVSVDVPKEKGYKFVEKVENRKEYAPYRSDYILVGDKVEIYFEHSSFVYQTHINFKKEHPDMDKDNPNFNDYVAVSRGGKEKIDFNGREAVKEEYKYGPGSGKLKGCYYFVNVEDIYGVLELIVLPTEENGDINALMEDPEVKVILNSIKVTAK